MTLRATLVIANLCSWALLVGLRPSLPDEYFAKRDAARSQGRFLISSADPLLVIAGRPLWVGGERTLVKVLEVVNLVPLLATVVAGAFVAVATHVPVYTQSIFAFVGLLLFTSAQWWAVGSAISAFHTWRQGRRTPT